MKIYVDLKSILKSIQEEADFTELTSSSEVNNEDLVIHNWSALHFLTPEKEAKLEEGEVWDSNKRRD